MLERPQSCPLGHEWNSHKQKHKCAKDGHAKDRTPAVQGYRDACAPEDPGHDYIGDDKGRCHELDLVETELPLGDQVVRDECRPSYYQAESQDYQNYAQQFEALLKAS